MTRYHMGDDGEPKVCSAKIKCGKESSHFEGKLSDARGWASEINDSVFATLQTPMVKTEPTVNIGGFVVPKKHEENFSWALETVKSDLAAAYGDEPAQLTMSVIHRLMMKTDSIVCARTRAVFFEKDHVFKVPITDEGAADTFNEERASQDYIREPENYIPIAHTEIIEDGMVCYSRMERVEPVHFTYEESKTMPFWVGMVDCGQVGYTKDGVLVAYDL